MNHHGDRDRQPKPELFTKHVFITRPRCSRRSQVEVTETEAMFEGGAKDPRTTAYVEGKFG